MGLSLKSIKGLIEIFAPNLNTKHTYLSNENPVKVLIVEDDTLQQDIWYRLLRRPTILVETCSTQREALIKLPEFDILILDWRIAGESTGQGIFDTWQDTKPEEPIIVISAYLDDNLKTSLLQSGAYNVLTKPVDNEAFVRIITRYAKFIANRRLVIKLQNEIINIRRTLLYLTIVVGLVLIQTLFPALEIINILQGLFS